MDNTRICHPFVDFAKHNAESQILSFTSDASKNSKLGMGAVFNNRWFIKQWPAQFIEKYNPSIEYLELYALVTALLMWRWDRDLHQPQDYNILQQ